MGGKGECLSGHADGNVGDQKCHLQEGLLPHGKESLWSRELTCESLQLVPFRCLAGFFLVLLPVQVFDKRGRGVTALPVSGMGSPSITLPQYFTFPAYICVC